MTDTSALPPSGDDKKIKEHEKRVDHLIRKGIAQKDKFIETARELGCEEGEERYDALVKKVGEQKPTPRKIGKHKKTD